jgi:hypothetical protein
MGRSSRQTIEPHQIAISKAIAIGRETRNHGPTFGTDKTSTLNQVELAELRLAGDFNLQGPVHIGGLCDQQNANDLLHDQDGKPIAQGLAKLAKKIVTAVEHAEPCHLGQIV